MKIIEALHWRYATKRMNNTKIPQEKLETILDAIALAPSSIGLQPYTIFVIEDKELLQKIKPIASNQTVITECSALLVFAAWENLTEEKLMEYLKLIKSVRTVSEGDEQKMKSYVMPQLKNPAEQNFVWNCKQAYIALGIGLAAAALEHIDSTPMEGFDKTQLDELLELRKHGLRSQVLLTLGNRDEANDTLIKEKKVRREKEKLFIRLA